MLRWMAPHLRAFTQRIRIGAQAPAFPTGEPVTSTSTTVRRIAFATSADLPSIQADDAYLATCLERQGLTPVSCTWNDPDVDWLAFDAVLIRTIWDYFRHYPAFLAWLERLDRLGVRTINDSALLRWNSDKRYLIDLAARGVATILSRLGASSELDGIVAAMRGQQVVIKPTVSGGAWHTVRGTCGDPSLDAALAALPATLTYLVQPFVTEIVNDGEWSLVYVAGRYSHAVLKRPATGDYRVQEEHGGTVAMSEPGAIARAAAERALEAVAALGYGEHAYARIDGVVSDGEFLIMELELLEPFLYLAGCPAAAERLALHIVTSLGT